MVSPRCLTVKPDKEEITVKDLNILKCDAISAHSAFLHWKNDGRRITLNRYFFVYCSSLIKFLIAFESSEHT